MDKNQGDCNSDVYSEGHKDHNEMRNLRESTLGDCWELMLNDNYFGIRQQVMNANNFELNPSLISMV